MSPLQTPCGTWRSPISAEQVGATGLGLQQTRLMDGGVVWVETRPAEQGRAVIVRADPGSSPRDLLSPPFSARSRVHEYGGGAIAVGGDTIFFVNDSDQRLYRLDSNTAPRAITPPGPQRYADMVVDVARDRLIAVCEDHGAGGAEPVNLLVTMDWQGRTPPQPLVEGHDFFAAPRLSPDGRRLAWLTWDHPRMPWQGSDLWLTAIDESGALSAPQHVAGSSDGAIVHPAWAPDGALWFVADGSGWWNLHRWRDGEVEAVAPAAMEFGRPHWIFGDSPYAFLAPDRVLCAVCERGSWRLVTLDAGTGAITPVETPYSEIAFVDAVSGVATFVGASPTASAAVVHRDAEGRLTELRRAMPDAIDGIFVARAETIGVPTEDGGTAYAFFYPPVNPDYEAVSGERPPLIVRCHGGPTSATSSALSLRLQFWTSRGFAVADVNYRGSTGYGRAYREALYGRWGEVDVADCVEVARFLAARGDVDPQRMVVAGNSAGGFTALCAIAFHDVFAGAAVSYAVTDPTLLLEGTHKFEAHYTDSLIGPYPERAVLYRARSPLQAAARIRHPLLIMQGLDDRVVPPTQAEAMVAGVRATGTPVVYRMFAGEGHGFRRAETVQQALETELAFYAHIFDLDLPGAVAPLSFDGPA